MKDFIISIIRFDPYIEKRRLDAIGREAGNENIPSEKSPEETANFSKHIEKSKLTILRRETTARCSVSEIEPVLK